MAEKAIRLGGESTAAAITQTVDGLYPEHKFNEADFTLKHNDDEIAVDYQLCSPELLEGCAASASSARRAPCWASSSSCSSCCWPSLAPGMNSYTYSGQELSQKNFAAPCAGHRAVSAFWTAARR